MLRQIRRYIEQENLPYVQEKKNKGDLFDRLLVSLGADYKKRDRLVEITVLEQELLEGLETAVPIEDRYYRIKFFSYLPFDVKPSTLGQVGPLLHFLNQLIDLPGFELHELENRVAFRYVLMTKGSGVDAKLIASLIGIIMFTLDLFGGNIEQVASGASTFNELLEEVFAKQEQT